MTLLNIYRYLVGAYYGMYELSYDVREYVLKDIETYIKEFIIANPSDIDYYKEAMDVRDNVPLRVKLQDLLIVTQKMQLSTDLMLLVKKTLKELDEA